MPNTNKPDSTQPFPAGAKIMAGPCGGVYCRGVKPTIKPVVRAMVGPTYRQAMEITLCADCLADFAVVNGPDMPSIHVPDVDSSGAITFRMIERFKVWAEGEDGLFHEVKGDLPRG